MGVVVQVIKCNIKGIDYNVRLGTVFTENYDETLDSGNLTIEAGSTKLVIDPFDSIIIHGDNIVTRRRLVDTMIERIVQFSPVKQYEYVITFFSETKQLENIPLPALSITKSKIIGERHDVWFYIERYMKYYSPKIRVLKSSPSDEWEYKYRWFIDDEIETIFTGVECPEFQWQASTLREVLTDLFSVKGLTPILHNDILTYYDLSKSGSEMNKSNINFIETLDASNEAITELQVNMKNVLQADKTIKLTEYIGFRNDNNGLLTDDNIQVILSNPIYSIKSVKLCHFFTYKEGADDTVNYNYRETDITECIKEKGEYDVLPYNVAVSTGDILTNVNITPDDYKALNVFYTRGDNKIDGWGAIKDGLFMGFVPFSITPYIAISHWAIRKDLSMPNPIIHTVTLDNDERDAWLRVEYETNADVVFKAGKYLPYINSKTVFDNQASSYVDATAQGILEYMKVNRLSNKTRVIYANYDSEDDIASLGDLYEGDIIFQREMTNLGAVIATKYTVAPYYVVQNYFVSVRSKLRSWQLIGINESAVRHDLQKYYCEFSFSPKHDENSLTSYLPDKYFATPLLTYTAEPLQAVMAVTYDKLSNLYPLEPLTGTPWEEEGRGYGYRLELDKKIVGKSLVLTTGFKDNYAVGNFVTKPATDYIQVLYPYADKNGEHFGAFYHFMTMIDPTDGAGFTWNTSYSSYGIDPNYTAFKNSAIERIRIKPLVQADNLTYRCMSISDARYKDNKEIPRLSVQFEFCSDTPEIIIGDKFLELQKMINESDTTSNYKIIASDSYYTISTTTTLSGIDITAPIAVTALSKTCTKITMPVGTRLFASYAVTDASGNLMMAVNNRGGLHDIVYLNLLRMRDTMVYNNTTEHKPIGSIVNADITKYVAITVLPAYPSVSVVLPQRSIVSYSSL